MTSTRRLLLALAWLAALLLAGFLLGRHLELSGDLRKFMPTRLNVRRAVMPEAASAASDRPVVVFCSWDGTCAPC
jgi:hypothetical protein